MAIDKGLYAAPEGITDVEDMADMPAIEIEIEDPESVSIEMGDIEIELRPQKPTAEDFDANLADFMDESELQSLGEELVNDFEKDINDRKDWMQTYVEGMKLLGLKYEERTEPWEGACGVFHPMLTESVVRFQSEGIMETFPSAGPVKTQVLGKDTPEKMEASARVVEDMNYQLTEVMTEYRPEHEKMLWNLPISGSAFKKVYFDPAKGRQVAMFIPAEDIVVPYGASSLETSERVTHVMRKTKNEIVKLQDAGFYSDVDLGEPKFELDDI
jgi:chaperonin GroES